MPDTTPTPTPDALLTAVYSSTATEPFDDERLSELLATSRTNNAGLGVTGMLLYRGGRFIQVLEGPDATVHDLLERIAADPRHDELRVLLQAPIEQRSFDDWTMGFEPIALPQQTIPEGFRDTFDDIESADETIALRAVRELTMWFRARSRTSS